MGTLTLITKTWQVKTWLFLIRVVSIPDTVHIRNCNYLTSTPIKNIYRLYILLTKSIGHQGDFADGLVRWRIHWACGKMCNGAKHKKDLLTNIWHCKIRRGIPLTHRHTCRRPQLINHIKNEQEPWDQLQATSFLLIKPMEHIVSNHWKCPYNNVMTESLKKKIELIWLESVNKVHYLTMKSLWTLSSGNILC